MSITILFFVVLIGWRLWHLTAHDKITRGLRKRLPKTTTQFLQCVKCAGWHSCTIAATLVHTITTTTPTWTSPLSVTIWATYIILYALAANTILIAVTFVWRHLRDTSSEYLNHDLDVKMARLELDAAAFRTASEYRGTPINPLDRGNHNALYIDKHIPIHR